MRKKSGTPFIHKFCVIHIIEGDLQFLARLFYAKRMMRFAEDNNYITDEQYGGRQQRMAQSAVLNMHVTKIYFTCLYYVCVDTRPSYF